MVSEEVGRSEAEIPLEGGEAGPPARPKAKGERIKANGQRLGGEEAGRLGSGKARKAKQLGS
jgi:hypothetical protein